MFIRKRDTIKLPKRFYSDPKIIIDKNVKEDDLELFLHNYRYFRTNVRNKIQHTSDSFTRDKVISRLVLRDKRKYKGQVSAKMIRTLMSELIKQVENLGMR